MNAINRWLRRKLRLWLGLGPSMLLTDLGFAGHSVIIIATRSAQGDRVKIIHAKFENLAQYQRAVDYTERMFGLQGASTIEDLPQGVNKYRLMKDRRGF